MRQVVAIVVGGAIGLGLMRLLVFLLELLELRIGDYAFLVVGVVGGLFLGLALGFFSKWVGVVVGLVSVVLLSAVGALAGPSVAELVIGALSYLMAGFIAGALSGVSYDRGYYWGSGSIIPGLVAGLLLLGFNLIYGFYIEGVVMELSAIVSAIVFALLLSSFGGAVGGQLGGVRV
ncbi:MAG: hypothetical protein IBX36_01735 [Dehalococcoidia bacterium]|nr:hypothetical protein [Dehalococcoidia bacterium]